MVNKYLTVSIIEIDSGKENLRNIIIFIIYQFNLYVDDK